MMIPKFLNKSEKSVLNSFLFQLNDNMKRIEESSLIESYE